MCGIIKITTNFKRNCLKKAKKTAFSAADFLNQKKFFKKTKNILKSA